ncbi:MAG: RNA polymerase sigma factor [Solirubrobacteraceae bacterium]
MNDELLADLVRAHWWGAVGTVTRLVGDIGVAEDAVQEACLAAVRQWPRDGVPANPSSWLIGAAHHKALDWVRREARRGERELQATRDAAADGAAAAPAPVGDDQLALVFTCCHPALDPAVRVPLTLRAVCGLRTAQIAAVFLIPEPTMAQRLVRAKRKIREAGIAFRVPPPELLQDRLADVLQVVYLMFTEGHRASAGYSLNNEELCQAAVRLARRLRELIVDEPEVDALLALLLLADARRPARTDSSGRLVLLGDQDRRLWDGEMIREGLGLLEDALSQRRPGPYQLQAAIAACHATAADLASTDWQQIAALYDRLWAEDPSPVVAANRAVAIAMIEGPEAGLELLDELAKAPAIQRWGALHIARGELLHRLGRDADAARAYRRATELQLPEPERRLINHRITTINETGRSTTDMGSGVRS